MIWRNAMNNVCIVGYGAIGPTHAKAIIRTENARVYAVCDINKERCAKGAKEYDALEYMILMKCLRTII